MPCTLALHGPGVMAVTCSIRREHIHCGVVGCVGVASAVCGYELTGARASRPTCQMALCVRHTGKNEGQTVCPPHRKLIERKGE